MDKLTRARTLVTEAHAQGLTVSMLGGAAIASLCTSARGSGEFARALGDVDLASTGKGRARVDLFLIESGLVPDVPFNQMNGYSRLRYFDEDGSHVDVFLDELRLCHVVDWKRSLTIGMSTLPIESLLLSKLQIVRLETKDAGDLSALFVDRWNDIWTARERLAKIVYNDWGLWRTGRGSLEQLVARKHELVAPRAEELLSWWRDISFGPKARLRAVVGDRIRWYEEPEEVDEE